MSSAWINYLFGPLDKSYCVYFYILSILFFISFIISLITVHIYLYKNYRKLNYSIISTGFISFFNLLLLYFVNRLLHTMCIKSI